MLQEGKHVRLLRDAIGEYVSAGSVGLVLDVVDFSKYGMGTLCSVEFHVDGEERVPLVKPEFLEVID